MTGRPLEDLRIGIAFQGDTGDRNAWSGSPAGLSEGLRALGVTVIGIRAEVGLVTRLDGRRGRVWTAHVADRRVAAISSLAGAVSLRRAGRLDGVVQVGTGFLLPKRTRIIQWDDLTVRQALDLDNPHYRRVTEKEARVWSARQAEAFRRSVACCVGSGWAARSVVEDYGIPAGKVHVVGFGRNIEVGPVERDWSHPRFLLIGREWELKNGPRVLRVFARLREEHPDATLDLVGGHPPIDQPGVTGHGRLLLGRDDHRSRLAALLGRATCVVVPTRHEAFGIAYADGSGAGVASIGTNVGGGVETIGPGGMVVDPLDDEALLTAMRRMCDPDTARALGQRAWEHGRVYSWPLVAERVLRALRPEGVDVERLAPFLPTDRTTRAPA